MVVRTVEGFKPEEHVSAWFREGLRSLGIAQFSSRLRTWDWEIDFVDDLCQRSQRFHAEYRSEENCIMLSVREPVKDPILMTSYVSSNEFRTGFATAQRAVGLLKARRMQAVGKATESNGRNQKSG